MKESIKIFWYLSPAVAIGLVSAILYQLWNGQWYQGLYAFVLSLIPMGLIYWRCEYHYEEEKATFA